jgi:hypothetical protein
MKFSLVLLLIFGGGGMLWFITASSQADEPKPVTGTQRQPIIVELFTSEGCSSCPPADALLTQLAQQNADIIPLSEHVDYWNYIGWADPFSSAVFSERQRRYADALGARGERGDVYTPQMVVDGRLGFVGSNAAHAHDAIAQALNAPKAHVQLTQLNNVDTTQLKIRITNLPSLSVNERAEVVFAVTENNLSSNVARGENRGRRLPHTAVTRELRALGEFPAKAQSFETIATVKLHASWKRSDLRFVVFVQEQEQRRILGAASVPYGNP